jgi:hypothetical protein
MSAQDGKSQPETVRISEGAAGGVVDVRPTSFLERWGTVFVAWGLAWMLLVASVLLGYYLLHLPAFPSTTGTPADVKVSLDIHKEIYEQYHDSITNVFDLLVTKTVLPLVTLLLGYLFGKTPSRPS